jgi:hypothetical protein
LAQGDFNYDGTVDFNDLVILSRNYNTSVGAVAAAAAVAPTPVMATVAPAPSVAAQVTAAPTTAKPQKPGPMKRPQFFSSKRV